MIWAFFAFGSMWFWMLTIGWLVLLTYWVEDEDTAWAFGSVCAFLALIHLFGDINIFTYLKANPMNAVQLVVVYAALGTGWGVLKFYMYNARFKRRIEALKVDFRKQYKLPKAGDVATIDGQKGATEDMKREWDKYWKNNLSHTDRDKMKLSNQSGKVIFWISYWPVSAFWTILNDPLRRLGKLIYNILFVRIFKWIHEKTVGKAVEL